VSRDTGNSIDVVPSFLRVTQCLQNNEPTARRAWAFLAQRYVELTTVINATGIAYLLTTEELYPRRRSDANFVRLLLTINFSFLS